VGPDCSTVFNSDEALCRRCIRRDKSAHNANVAVVGALGESSGLLRCWLGSGGETGARTIRKALSVVRRQSISCETVTHVDLFSDLVTEPSQADVVTVETSAGYYAFTSTRCVILPTAKPVRDQYTHVFLSSYLKTGTSRQHPSPEVDATLPSTTMARSVLDGRVDYTYLNNNGVASGAYVFDDSPITSQPQILTVTLGHWFDDMSLMWGGTTNCLGRQSRH